MTDLKCKHCSRHLGEAHGSAIVTLICPNSSCKAENQIKIVSSDREKDLNFKFANAPRPPKTKEVEVS